ncbi:MAG: relaxase/mobilization nuclease domain-containing protein [Rhizomicrobium sp.]
MGGDQGRHISGPRQGPRSRPMIIKGGSRAAPDQLARHLQRTDTNESVEIIQLDSPTGSLREAMRDWQTIAAATRGTKGLYHANIDPDARYTMTAEQWKIAVDRLEKELGLEGQPRAVVMHEKHGRQHIHVVWQRTDIDTMTMIPDSYNYVAHERASLALENEFGHEHVPGKHAKRDREKQPEFPKEKINHAEWQQAERAGVDPHAFKDAITAIYKSCDNGQAFQAALEQHGFVLAKGDRRGHVLVAEDGQVYSLARQINLREKDLRAFMADVEREALPTVEQAKALQEQRRQALEQAPAQSPEAPQPPTPEPTGPTKEETAALEQALGERHAEEGRQLRLRQEAEYEETSRILDEESREKLGHFDALQQAAREIYFRETYRAKTGFSGFIDAIRERLNPQQMIEAARERKEAADAFLRSQEHERDDRIARLKTAQTTDLADLAERHQQQQREHSARFDEERARYLREFDAAAKLLAEIEERRRQEELRAEQERSRDGPAPPKLTQ